MFPVQQESTTNLRHFEVSFPPVHRVHRRKKNIKIWWVEFNEVLYNLHAHSLPTFSHRLFSCFQLNQLAFGVSLVQLILSYFATTYMSQSYQSLKWFFSLLLSFQLNWCDPHPPLDVSREPYTVAPPTLAFQSKNVTPITPPRRLCESYSRMGGQPLIHQRRYLQSCNRGETTSL